MDKKVIEYIKEEEFMQMLPNLPDGEHYGIIKGYPVKAVKEGNKVMAYFQEVKE